MNLPTFTAEASLYSSQRIYRPTASLGLPSGLGVQMARFVSCSQICAGDPDPGDCMHCCRCVQAGGHPSHCCI